MLRAISPPPNTLSCNCTLLSRGANLPSISVDEIALITVINHLVINYLRIYLHFLYPRMSSSQEVVSDTVVIEVVVFVNINKIPLKD